MDPGRRACGHERRAIKAGADAFLAKPFRPRRLCELVNALAVGTVPRSPA
jgi:DNA-binding response OmpR family regulator